MTQAQRLAMLKSNLEIYPLLPRMTNIFSSSSERQSR